jgi:putative tricarboxylic transport membrane protein
MKQRLWLALPHAVLLLVAGCLYYATSFIDTAASATRLGPDFWPKIIIGALAALCVYEMGKRLIIGAARDAGGLTASLDRPPAAIDSGSIEMQASFDNRKLVAGIAVVAGFVVGVAYVGFFIATALFVALFCWIGGYRQTVPIVLASVLGAFILLVIFMRVTYVSLPLGVGLFKSLSILLLQLIGV